MVNVEEKKRDKDKKGFIWVEDISDPIKSDYTGAYEPIESDYDWDNDRYDPGGQACQTVHHAGDFWSDYAGSASMDEPQERQRAELIQRGLEINENAEFDVHRLVASIEQRDKEHKATLDRILAQTSSPTIWQRIQENAMDYFITLAIGGVAVGLWLWFVG